MRSRAARVRDRDLRRSSRSGDATALIPGARSDVDDPIVRPGNVHVVLHHDDGVAGLDQTVELRHQFLDVGRVQSAQGRHGDAEGSAQATGSTK